MSGQSGGQLRESCAQSVVDKDNSVHVTLNIVCHVVTPVPFATNLSRQSQNKYKKE